ncbi:hypothetical protein MNBD_NITROSPINAE03-1737 [hydrothermal vent metagenome]|uniref:Uncharacterized protein n=1 Tax=hydrothermal vent metagenome TaxID=652676 RepID=A0A3B1C0V7_9ZZZZ
MARYTKIVKKKDKTTGILDSTESAKTWAQHNLSTIALALGTALLIMAAGYGVAYYRQTSAMDAQTRLFEAANLREGDTTDRLRKVIERGGPDKVILQARLQLANHLFDNGKYKEAAEEYSRASTMSDKGTLLYDLAILGEAKSMARAGELSKAEAKYRELSDNATNYPKTDALLNLAFVQAGMGKKDEAIATFEKLKSEKTSAEPEAFFDNAIKNVREGKLAGVTEKAAISDGKKQDSDGAVTNLKIHESGSGGQ